MSPSLRSSSISMLILFAISYIIPFTTALPTNLQLRQDAELPVLLNFVPSCARNCVSAKIAPMNCADSRVESCLCGDDPQSFKNSLWQCIDGNCGGEGSSFHQAAEANVEGLCQEPVSTTLTTQSPTSTQFATGISAHPSLGSIQSSSATAEESMSPSVEATVSISQTVPVSTRAGSSTGNKEKKRTGLSTPAIIGISIGSFSLLAAIVGSFVYCAVAREKKNQKKQVRSMTFEPHSRNGEVVGGKADRGALGSGIWMSINSTSSSTLAGGSYSPNQPVQPIDTNVAREEPNVYQGSNISPMSPVSPIVPQGFEFGKAVQQQGKSQKIIEHPHLSLPPMVTYTPASPIEAVGEMSPPIPPAPALAHPYNDLPGMAISADLPMGTSASTNNLSTIRPTCSTIATSGYPDDPSSPSPVSASSESARSFLQSSHNPLAAGISRSDTLSWRRVLDEAAGRAVTRVVRSEQTANEEMDVARRRKSSIPGLDKFSRRLSRDNRADEDGGERSWGGFGSRNSRGSPPRSLMNSKRSNSDGSTNSRSERVPDGGKRRDK